MRAAIWDGPGVMSVGTVADADCPEDGVLLRVTACGICGTDVRTLLQRRPADLAARGCSATRSPASSSRSARGAADPAMTELAVGDPVHCISTLWCGTLPAVPQRATSTCAATAS